VVKVRFDGVGDPKAAFDALRPYRKALIALQQSCRPFQSDYLVLDAARKALDTAAYHFTGEPDFFALKPERSAGGESG
jgi:hypothetical protein